MLHVKLSGRFLKVEVAVHSRRIVLVAVGNLRACHDVLRFLLVDKLSQDANS
jgi:hypothetical protein